MRRSLYWIVAMWLCLVCLLPQAALAAPLGELMPPPDMPMAAVPTLKKAATATPSPAASSRPEIAAVRWLVHNDGVSGESYLRIVIDTTVPVKVQSALSSKVVPQLVVDIRGAGIGAVDSNISLDGDIADKAKISRIDSVNSRMTIDLPATLDRSDYKVFTLQQDPANNKLFRVVIDINKPVPKANIVFTPGLRNKVIVIDPGHGGSDPGAIGPNKTQEKDLTLAVALKAQALLEKAGAKVIMTRRDDRDVFGVNASATDELKARAMVGNNNNADVFLSIHINSFSGPNAVGTSTYYYQKTGYDGMLAQAIQDGLIGSAGLDDRGIASARFYVLKRTTMPAILAELGFISNPEEERKLNQPQFQQQMAQGLVKGLESFFQQASAKGGRG